MSNALPFLYNSSGTLNAQVLYGFTRVVSCLTDVMSFQAATEQRWVSRNPLFNFAVPMASLSAADKAAWLAFFNTVKGRFTSDLSITLGATLYANLVLDSDALPVVNRLPTFYDQQISLHQTSNYPWTIPSVGGSYPALLFGGGSAVKVAERPFTQVTQFFTDVSASPYGQQYAYEWYGASLTGFPTGPLHSWKLSYPLLTDADALTIETFFLGQQGRYGIFSFTDPISGTTYTKVRFASDNLAFQYLTKNQQSTELTLMEFN